MNVDVKTVVQMLNKPLPVTRLGAQEPARSEGDAPRASRFERRGSSAALQELAPQQNLP
jgi:hypothetical protein